MGMIWVLFGVLVLVAGLRHRQRINATKRSRGLDDAAIDQIIREGTLTDPEAEREADRQAAAEAEEEFWSEYWDEPDEY